MMKLNDKKIDCLINRIRNSFRVRKNNQTEYIDFQNHSNRIKAPQHQVIFGRRGSGKSCLLVSHLNEAKKGNILPIYLLADEYKTLTYPNILIRLILEISRETLDALTFFQKLFKGKDLKNQIKKIEALLDLPDDSEMKLSISDSSSKKNIIGGKSPVSGSLEENYGSAKTEESHYKRKKLQELEKHLPDFKRVLEKTINETKIKHVCVLIDDFYLLDVNRQPEVIDYLHRLCRDTRFYLKVATIKHRTQLSRGRSQTIGVELMQDVEEINLDKTLETFEETKGFLEKMLLSISAKDDIFNAQELFNREGFEKLVLASGGVPRDFLNIFINSLEVAREKNDLKWLTPTHIWKGAARLLHSTKLPNLKEDSSGNDNEISQMFKYLKDQILDKSKRTVFLVNKDDIPKYHKKHELLLQLMDLKIIHIIDHDTSSKAHKGARFEAFVFDFSIFMEPRRRNIEVIEFWMQDEYRNKKGLRDSTILNIEQFTLSDSAMDSIEETILKDEDAVIQSESN